MATLSFQPGATWRKLGFAVYSDSLAYREVLKDNPQWDVLSHPPLGTVLRGKRAQSNAGAGLSQQPSVISPISGSSSLLYYPFDNLAGYLESLRKYSPSALKSVERVNGWSSNDIISDTGLG
jgi:hypothetical protein